MRGSNAGVCGEMRGDAGKVKRALLFELQVRFFD